MASEKVTDLTAQTSVNLTDTYHVVNTTDTSQDPAGSSYKISWATLKAAILLFFSAGTGITYSGGVISSDPTATQTLTNKTLTSPTINTPTISTPSVTAPTITGTSTFNGTYAGSMVIPLANGGTGGTTQTAAANAVLPTQTSNSGKFLTTDGSNSSWGNPASLLYIQSTFTAGEPLTAGNAVFLSAGTETKVMVDLGLTNTSPRGFGDGSTYQSAMSFTVGSSAISVKKVVVGIGKNGSPADNVIIAIQADSAGLPSGINLISTTIAGSGLSTGAAPPAPQTITFSSSQPLSASTKYWVVLSRSGIPDPTNNYNIGVVSGAGLQLYNGSVWNSNATAAQLQIIEQFTTGQVYLANANVTGFYNSYIGIAAQTVAVAATVLVTLQGIDANQSGLSPGSQYYLANSYGGIGSSAGANTRKVGIALSTTQLFLTNIW